jgi:hypothetical protein
LSKNEVNKSLRKENIELYDDIDNQYDRNYYESVDYESVDYETVVENDIDVNYTQILE